MSAKDTGDKPNYSQAIPQMSPILGIALGKQPNNDTTPRKVQQSMTTPHHTSPILGQTLRRKQLSRQKVPLSSTSAVHSNKEKDVSGEQQHPKAIPQMRSLLGTSLGKHQQQPNTDPTPSKPQKSIDSSHHRSPILGSSMKTQQLRPRRLSLFLNPPVFSNKSGNDTIGMDLSSKKN